MRDHPQLLLLQSFQQIPDALPSCNHTAYQLPSDIALVEELDFRFSPGIKAVVVMEECYDVMVRRAVLFHCACRWAAAGRS